MTTTRKKKYLLGSNLKPKAKLPTTLKPKKQKNVQKSTKTTKNSTKLSKEKNSKTLKDPPAKTKKQAKKQTKQQTKHQTKQQTKKQTTKNKRLNVTKPKKTTIKTIQPNETTNKIELHVRRKLTNTAIDSFLNQLELLKPISKLAHCSGCYVYEKDLELFLKKWCLDCGAKHHASMAPASVLVLLLDKKNQRSLPFRQLYKMEIGQWHENNVRKNDYFVPNKSLLSNYLRKQCAEARRKKTTRFALCHCELSNQKDNDNHAVGLFFYICPNYSNLKLNNKNLEEKNKGLYGVIKLRFYNPTMDWNYSQMGNDAIVDSMVPWIETILPGWSCFNEPVGICPRVQGLQERQENENAWHISTFGPKGFCQTWTAIVILIAIGFPDASLEEIALNILKNHSKNLTSFVERISYNIKNKNDTFFCCQDLNGKWIM
jgi:hypothetical protein